MFVLKFFFLTVANGIFPVTVFAGPVPSANNIELRDNTVSA